jgi:hypothetical protein
MHSPGNRVRPFFIASNRQMAGSVDKKRSKPTNDCPQRERRAIGALSSPLRLFPSTKDELAMLFQGLKACLEGSQQRYRYLSIVALLESIRDNLSLPGDTVLELCDEPFSLG